MTEYRALFEARGQRYNRANRRFPAARAEEAEHLIAHLQIGCGQLWLDVAAGGGFLADRAAAQGVPGTAVGCDESAVFLADSSSYALRTVAAYDRLPFPDRVFAAAGCLAALHHAEAPADWIAEMLRVTAAGGRVALGDVVAGSRAAAFLNAFVDTHTETGHAGRFYDPGAFLGFLAKAGGGDPQATLECLHWSFASRSDARDFCRELFGLLPETPEPDLDRALSALGLGGVDGRWILPWDMVFASAAAR
jgi:SAM-dependent methyltransferase